MDGRDVDLNMADVKCFIFFSLFCYRIRLNNIKKLSIDKTLDNVEENHWEILTRANIKLNLLQVKMTQSISLNLNENLDNNRETGNKGGTFVLYNVSRLAAIKAKYFQRVNDNFYPKLPPVDELSFKELTEFEEWSLLFNYLLEYPSLIEKSARDLIDGKPAIHNICNYLFNLCSLFSVYYRRVRILLVNLLSSFFFFFINCILHIKNFISGF